MRAECCICNEPCLMQFHPRCLIAQGGGRLPMREPPPKETKIEWMKRYHKIIKASGKAKARKIEYENRKLHDGR